MREKIYFEKFSYYSFLTILIVILPFFILITVSVINDIKTFGTEVVVFSLCLIALFIGFFASCICFILWGHTLFLTYVIREKDCYTQFFLKKKMCQVNTKEPVYYAIADVTIGRSICKCIFLSNVKFGFKYKAYGRNYEMDSINELRNTLITPYDKDTMGLFDLENWISVRYEKAEIVEKNFAVYNNSHEKRLFGCILLMGIPLSYIVDLFIYGIALTLIDSIYLIFSYSKKIKVDMEKDYFEYTNNFRMTTKVYYDEISEYIINKGRITICSGNKKFRLYFDMINSDKLLSILDTKLVKKRIQ